MNKVSALPTMAHRIAPLGWHINLQLDGRDLPQFEVRLLAMRCPVAIEKCSQEEPVFKEINPDHFVACWLAE
jgi:D-galactarolactone isomerase